MPERLALKQRPLHTKSTAARQARRASYKYPSLINVYNQGLWLTCFVGVFRLTTVVVFGLGAFILFPIYLRSSRKDTPVSDKREQKIPSYWPWMILVGSCVPMVVAFMAFGPMVHQVHVEVPVAARRSKDELMRWASKVPRNTVFRFSAIRFLPWPQSKEICFFELVRLPLSRIRLANLEYKPIVNEPEIRIDRKGQLSHGIMKRALGRYFVSRTQLRDKSAVPGVWDSIWEQIPFEDDQKRDRKETRWMEGRAPGPRIVPPKAKL